LPMLPDWRRFELNAQRALRSSKTWAEALEALRTYPSLMRHSWARDWMSSWMRKSALKTDAPLSTLQELCAQMKKAAMSDAGVRNSWWVRQTVATSWAEMASRLAIRPARQREAAYAAARAIALAPSLVVRRALLPIIARGALGF